MKFRIVPFVLCAGLLGACRSEDAAPQPAAPAPKPVAAAPAKVEAPAVAPAAAPVDARAERLSAITKEQRETSDAYFGAVEKALGENKNPSADDWNKAEAAVKTEGKFPEPDSKAYEQRVQKLLDEDATDITAFHALAWMLDNMQAPEQHARTIALLEQHHMERVEMGTLCSRFAQKDRGLLDTLAAKSPHAEVRGQACFAQADALKRDMQYAERIHDPDAKDLERLQRNLGDEKFAALQKLDVAAAQKEVEQIYERIAKEYGDVKLYAGTKRETTLGKNADAALFEMRNLAVGKPAPQIEGVDLDSVAFKLSDYQGKVVLLDFWGNW
jgi:hypothetical protein